MHSVTCVGLNVRKPVLKYLSFSFMRTVGFEAIIDSVGCRSCEHRRSNAMINDYISIKIVLRSLLPLLLVFSHIMFAHG